VKNDQTEGVGESTREKGKERKGKERKPQSVDPEEQREQFARQQEGYFKMRLLFCWIKEPSH